MRIIAPIISLVLASSAAAYLPFRVQRPIELEAITTTPQEQESYDGHQVWRLDWSEMDRSTKDSLRDVINVSQLPLSRSDE
jgi:hypothetical protein